jgi:hypothetical protein
VVDILGLDLYRAHIAAHRLEHAISPELEECIRVRLGNPTTNPFGRPIPGSGYQVPAGSIVSLADAPQGSTYEVDRIPEEDPELLAFLIDHGVVPGAVVTVVEEGKYLASWSSRPSPEKVHWATKQHVSCGCERRHRTATTSNPLLLIKKEPQQVLAGAPFGLQVDAMR